MARQPNAVPTYRLHRKTGRAIVTVRDHLGVRRDMLLPGPHGSAESLAEYERLKALTGANRGRLPVPPDSADQLTVNGLICRFLKEHVETYYVDGQTGAASREQDNFRDALKALKRLFGERAAAALSPGDLRLLRDAYLTGSWRNDEERRWLQRNGRRLDVARSTANKYIGRVRMMYRWAVEMMLVPPATLTGLQALKSLQRGRTTARETREVVPVDLSIVEATLPCLPAVVADMVRVQLLTGARPGEICAMRVRALDMTGPVWTYSPKQHKTAWRGHARNIPIGPKAQAILAKYLKPTLDAYLFSPAEADAARKEQLRRQRKTRVQPSQVCRRKKNARRKPGARYRVNSYTCAVGRGCRKAGVAHWHPHQLRHLASLLIEREHGLEAARAMLGHRTVNQTTHYSGLDLKRAADVAAKIG